MEGRKKYAGSWDGISVAVSVLCLVHCVVLPLLVSVLPLFRIRAFEDARIEWLMLALTALIGGWAIRNGFRYHRNKAVGVAFLTGLLLVASGNFIHSAELVLKGAGAVLVIFAHVRNWSLSCRSCALQQRTQQTSLN